MKKNAWKLLFGMTLVASAVMALGDLIIPQIVRLAIDYCLNQSKEPMSSMLKGIVGLLGGLEQVKERLWLLPAAIVAVALVRAIFTYLFRLCNTWGTEILVKNLRDQLFAQIAHLPFSWHMKNPTGDIIQRCTSDIETLRGFVADKLTSLLRIFILLILSLGFMLMMNPMLTLIAFIPMPVIVIYSVIFHNKLRQGFLECDENEGILSNMAQENFTGVRVVRAFGREQSELQHFEKHNHFYTGLWVKMAKLMSRFWSTSDVLAGMQIMLVVIFGALFCTRNRMTPGEYVAFISYNSMLTWPIRELGRTIADMSRAGVSLERIRYILESPVEKDEENAVTTDFSGDIEFEHVNFAYENCPVLLKDIDFTIKGGTTLGILGGTGSGKSTLMMLLDRFYDLPEECGKITIGGIDIRRLQGDALRRNIGIVLQEPYLFSRTIAENIGIAQENMTLSQIREAARAACLDEAVMGFVKKYDTFVGERGVTLSGGQKQRAAIARVLASQPPIMIFDDSLSAVDTRTDEMIRKSLEEHFGKATIIIISHRITTLQKADHILVLDNGCISEQGTHESLKQAGGLYQRIYEIQSGLSKDMEKETQKSHE